MQKYLYLIWNKLKMWYNFIMTKTEKLKNYFKTTFSKNIFLICFGLAFLYFISGYLHILEITTSIIAIISFVFLPLQASCCIFFFMHNFLTSQIAWDLGYTITFIGFVLITMCRYIKGIKKNKYTYNIKIIISFSVALFISLFASIGNKIYGGALIYLIYLPLIYIMFLMRNEINLRQVIDYMLFGFVLSNVLALIGQILPNYGYYYGLSRYQALTDNPNYLSMRATFLFTYYFSLYFKKEISLFKALLIYAFCVLVTFATQSKTGIILLALFSLIFVVLYIKQDFKKNFKYLIIFIIAALIVILLCHKLILQVLQRFIPEDSNIISSLLTGRDEIWLMYWNECVKNPITILFGNGLISQEVYIPSQDITRTSHNLYLFLFYRFGLIGCIALGIGFFFMCKELSKNKPTFVSSLPLIWYLILSLVDNTFLSFNITFLPLALLYMFNNKNEDTKLPSNNNLQKTVKTKNEP